MKSAKDERYGPTVSATFRDRLYYVMLCYAMLCHVMLCYAMLCYVTLCYVMLCYVMLCFDATAHKEPGPPHSRGF